MQLHYNWMVLVAIVWTIHLDASVQESIINIPRIQRDDGKHSDEDSHKPVPRNSTDDVGRTILDTATISSRETTKSRSDMETDIIDNDRDIKANNQNSRGSPQANESKSASIFENDIDTNNDYFETADKHHYSNDGGDHFNLVHRSELNPVSSTENFAASLGANKRKDSSKRSASNFSKSDTIDGTFDSETLAYNESLRQELQLRNVVSNFSKVSNDTAPLNSNSKASRMNYRTTDMSLETQVDEYHRESSEIKSTREISSGNTQWMGFQQFRKSNENSEFDQRSLPVTKKISFSTNMGANNDVKSKKESLQMKAMPVMKIFHVGDPPNSEFFKPFVESDDFKKKEVEPSGKPRKNPEFLTKRRTKNIDFITISNYNSQALFIEDSIRNSKQLETRDYTRERRISGKSVDSNFQQTNMLSEKRQLKKPSSVRPEMKMVSEQLRKVQDINYLESKKAKKSRSYSTPSSSSGSSVMNSEKFSASRQKAALKNNIFRRRRSDRSKNNEQVETPDLSDGTKSVSSVEEVVDNTVNPDRATGNRDHRSVVKIAGEGFETDQRSHKSLIAQESTAGINVHQDQKWKNVQERKEQVQEHFSEMGIPQIGRSHLLEDVASGSITLENSSAFSSLTAMQRKTIQRESSVTPKRTRKMEFSKSDLDDTRVSRNKKTGSDRVISSKGFNEISPTSVPIGEKEQRLSVDERDLTNAKANIDWHIATDTTTTVDSSFGELRPRECGPDDNGEGKYDCNGDGVTIEVVRLRVSGDPRFKALQHSSGEKMSGSQSNARSKLVASLVSSTRIESAGNDVAAVLDDKVNRKNPKDKTASSQRITSNKFSSILLDDQPSAGYITNVTRPLAPVVENDQADKHVPMKHGFFGQENYKRKRKVDTTYSATEVNNLKVRDSTAVKNDSSKVHIVTRNNTDGKTVRLDRCETCEIVDSAKNTSIQRERKGYIGSDQSGHEHVENVEKKIESSVTKFREIKSSDHVEITTAYKIGVGPALIAGDGSSLAQASAESKVIDRLRPEARVGEQLRNKNTEMLVRGQEPISIASVRENLILSREIKVDSRPSEGLNATENYFTSELIIGERNENIDNGTHGHPDAGTRERQSYYPAKEKAYAEHAQGSFIPRVVESFTDGRNSSLEFSNNALTIPRSPGNFSIYATAQTRSLTASGRRRKSLGHDAVTGGSTSSTKTDSSIWPIGRTWDDDRYSMRKEHLDVSQSRVSNVSLAYGELQNDTAAEQMKRGFTSKGTITIAVTEPSTIRYREYTNPDTILSSRTQDIKSNENITQTIEVYKNESEVSNTNLPIIKTEESWTTANILPHEVVSNPSTISVTISIPENDHHDLTKPLNEEKFSSSTEQTSAILLKPHSEQREIVGIDLKSDDGLSLNHTDRDNSTRITATLNQWPVKHSAVVEGDLLLGGLMMVHEREDSITCGPVMPQGGVQALEAMLYTLDWLNKRDLVPGVKIGAHILDDCDKDTYGLEMAVDFIKGSISNIDGAEYHCNKTAVRKVISGVVGAASSVTSIQVANLLRLFRIPQVSFFSTSPELSNKMRFEYFTRTIPSDHYQVKAMVDIVLVMGWSYVSIIYEESNYGEKAYEELEKLLGKHEICIAVKEKLSKDSGVAEAHVYDNIVLKLLTKPRARGCIIFASDQEVAGVMKAVRRCNATGAFSWIGSDGWSARSLVSDGNEPEMEGTLSVQPQANPVEGFEDYFLNLTVENNRRNPWFVEFWEDHFKCRYPNASQTPYNNYTEECTTTEKLTKQNTAFEDQLQFVSDAVLAFAYAFREMHKNLCHGNRGLCDAMKPTKGTELLNYLRNVEFKGLSGDVFHFDKNGDGPARYNIIHFKQVSPGKYKWIRVGKYLEGELRLNMSEIQFRLGHPEPPESVCSLPCEVGQAKKYVEGESCCWHCFNCTQYQIRHINDETQCVLCPQGTVPDETHSYCRDIPEEFLRPESGWAIGAMSFSSTGILITLFVGGVFLKHNDTPIVRASGRELSYVLLVGILMCYLVTFALVLRPNDFVCSIQRFSAGFCFTVVYAALLTKTNRISRIFNAGKHSAKRPSFISPRSQLIICSMLVGVQILINGVWMVIDPAKAMHHYPTREDNLLVCNSYIDASYMIAFTYPIILIVVCTVYAVLTRKIPEAFNESKHIGFTMYTTCVIWLAFVPLYFATGSHVALRITSMSVTISLSASVTIACLFSPKLYIILIHPERNVRPNMMMQNRYNTTKGSVVTATNASMAPVTLTAVTCDQGKAVKKHFITTIDSSTQIEQYEMELKDQKNGKITPAVVNRETQTLLNNNGKESSAVTSPVIMDIKTEEIIPSKGLNIGKIANGPMNQNEVPL